MSTIVYGRSDDLIEFDGDLHDERGHFADEAATLLFSDGTELEIGYGANNTGVWRITLRQRGSLFDHIAPCPDPTGESADYTDVAHFKDGLAWATVGRWEQPINEEYRDRNDPRVVARDHALVMCATCQGTGLVVARSQPLDGWAVVLQTCRGTCSAGDFEVTRPMLASMVAEFTKVLPIDVDFGGLGTMVGWVTEVKLVGDEIHGRLELASFGRAALHQYKAIVPGFVIHGCDTTTGRHTGARLVGFALTNTPAVRDLDNLRDVTIAVTDASARKNH